MIAQSWGTHSHTDCHSGTYCTCQALLDACNCTIMPLITVNFEEWHVNSELGFMCWVNWGFGARVILKAIYYFWFDRVKKVWPSVWSSGLGNNNKGIGLVYLGHGDWVRDIGLDLVLVNKCRIRFSSVRFRSSNFDKDQCWNFENYRDWNCTFLQIYSKGQFVIL